MHGRHLSGAAQDLLRVVDPGPMATLQDLGRPGHGALGIPSGGAMDDEALRLGNVLVGNPPAETGIEVMMFRPTKCRLTALDYTVVAVTGADTRATIGDRPIPLWSAQSVRPGETLTLSGVSRGCRAYVTVRHGLAATLHFGSSSTYLPGGLGGFEGRALRTGDVLRGTPSHVAGWDPPLLDASRVPRITGHHLLRVIVGLQADFFQDVDEFLAATWRVSPRSNRVGVTLEGPELHFKPRGGQQIRAGGGGASHIISDGNPRGAIQVPGGMALVIIGPDGPCAGGYAKIATVISADLHHLGQMRPADAVRFESVNLEEAYVLLRQYRADTRAIMCGPAPVSTARPWRRSRTS